MEEPKDRLKRARLAAGYATPTEAAAASRGALGKDLLISNENGHRPISRKAAQKYAEAFGVKAGWILYGDDDVPELTYVPLDDLGREIDPDTPAADPAYDREHYKPQIPGAIPELDVKAGAGEGAVGEVMVIPAGPAGTVSAHRIVDEWAIPPRWLREAVHDPQRAIVMEIEGDSMLPNYAPGDRVVIDLSVNEMGPDGVYLITDGYSPPQVKRLQRVMFTVPQMVKIISDNERYTVAETDLASVRVLGKISAYVGRR